MNALTTSTTSALQARAKSGVSLFDASRRLPSHAPDFFSNDYLSLSSFPQMRRELLEKLDESPHLFGSQGSRALNGTTDNHIGLEKYFRELYEAPAAMIFNSGYIANLSFLGGVPQPGDVYVHDELVHASCHDGMQMSRARNAMFSFTHNSPSSFESCILRVLEDFPQISAGKSTMFIVLESTYSMDGDFCPLQEFVALVEKHVPPSAAHIIVDEAHSLGLCGPRGMGLVKHLGLENRVHTVIHPLTKAPNFIGAFILTSPAIYQYIANYSRPFLFSTSLPHIDLITIKHCFNTVVGPLGAQQRQLLHLKTHLFHRLILKAFVGIPRTILTLPDRSGVDQATGLISPIFPILTSRPVSLQHFLNARGYTAQSFTFPVVPRGQDRIRVVIHANNTQDEIRTFVAFIRVWGLQQLDSGLCMEAKL